MQELVGDVAPVLPVAGGEQGAGDDPHPGHRHPRPPPAVGHAPGGVHVGAGEALAHVAPWVDLALQAGAIELEVVLLGLLHLPGHEPGGGGGEEHLMQVRLSM